MVLIKSVWTLLVFYILWDLLNQFQPSHHYLNNIQLKNITKLSPVLENISLIKVNAISWYVIEICSVCVTQAE